MLIGGVVACSLSDFPGRIASVVFTQGCNWRCPWCHNPALVHPDHFAPPLDEVNVLRRFACSQGKIDGVVVSGGEPTLQPDLVPFFAQLKGLGFETKLDTNGSRPAVVRTLVERRYVDFVAVDVKAPWSRYGEAAGTAVDTEAIAETIALLRSAGIEHQLRTTRWPGLSGDDEREILTIADGSPHVWQDYRAVANG